MSIWIVVASKYGATREIAEAIAEELGKGGQPADVKNADEIKDFRRAGCGPGQRDL